MLWAWLRFARGTAEAKVNHLDDDAARRRLVPSATTLARVLSHLTTVYREVTPTRWHQREVPRLTFDYREGRGH